VSLCNWSPIFQRNVVPSSTEVDRSHSISFHLPPPPNALGASWCPLIPTASVLHSSSHLLILGPCLFQGTCIIYRMVAIFLDFLPWGRQHLCYVLMIKPVTWLYPSGSGNHSLSFIIISALPYNTSCLPHPLLPDRLGNLSRQPITGFTVPTYSCHPSLSDILL